MDGNPEITDDYEYKETYYNRWNGYNDVKHNRESNFTKATYINAVSALSALYILVFYLSKITGIEFKDYASQYFDSEYANGFFLHNSGKPLPDYET